MAPDFLAQAERRWESLKVGRQIGALALLVMGIVAFVLSWV